MTLLQIDVHMLQVPEGRLGAESHFPEGGSCNIVRQRGPLSSDTSTGHAGRHQTMTSIAIACTRDILKAANLPPMDLPDIPAAVN